MSHVRAYYRRSANRKLERMLWAIAALLVVFLLLTILVQTAAALA
jgi:hypothetical protein